MRNTDFRNQIGSPELICAPAWNSRHLPQGMVCMPYTIEEWKNLAAATQSAATIASFVVGGIWVYTKYIRQQERYPNIEFSADVQFIGVQDGFWITELIATVENKGKAQHRMEEFG